MGTHFSAWKPRQGPDKDCFAVIFVLSFLTSTIAFSPLETQSLRSIMTGIFCCSWNRMHVTYDERPNSHALLAGRGIIPRHRLGLLTMTHRNRVFKPKHVDQLNQRKSIVSFNFFVCRSKRFKLAQSSKEDFANSANEIVQGLNHDGFAQAP